MLKNILSGFISENKKFFIFLFIVSLLYGISIVTSNYLNLPASNLRDYILISFHWVYVCFSSLVLIYILMLNRWVFILLFPVFIAASSIAAYYTYKFDITINSAIINSFFHTNIEEAAGVINIQLVLYFVFMITLGIFLSYFRFKKIILTKKTVHVMLIILGLLLSQSVNKIRYGTLAYRIPYSFYYAIKQYRLENKLMKQAKINISEGAYTLEDSLTVVLILGEALRADHIGLNGYFRNTTPLLQKNGIISYPNIYSEWTHTNLSLPHILTRADSINAEPVYNETSFISIFKECGYYTVWLGNQIPNKSFIGYINECDTSVINKPFHSEYNLSKKLDEDLLPHLKNIINSSSSKKLIIIHQLGSHWFYPSHYPDSFSFYTPVIDGKTFTDDDKDKIINAYDNSVRYTDYNIAKTIELLKNEKAFIIYISDHGELLGEDGKWLHAQNTVYEKNPAFFIWFSDYYKNKYPYKVENSIKKKDKRYRTDIIFHSIIDASAIRTEFYDSTLSIFNSF